MAVRDHAASALAAFTVCSSIKGAFILLCTFPVYGRVGYGGNSMLAFLNLALCLISALVYEISRNLGSEWVLQMDG